jgi:polysaccharide pyruvyl transferase WcaK-like protein
LHVDSYTTAGAEVFDYMDAQGKAFAQSTNRPYRRTNNRIESSSKPALATTLALYTGADMVISSGLHGCIIAVAMGRKVLAVSGDYKIEGFMELAGLGDWVLDIGEVHALPELLVKLPTQDPCEPFVMEAFQANQAVGAKIIDLLGRL